MVMEVGTRRDGNSVSHAVGQEVSGTVDGFLVRHATAQENCISGFPVRHVVVTELCRKTVRYAMGGIVVHVVVMGCVFRVVVLGFVRFVMVRGVLVVGFVLFVVVRGRSVIVASVWGFVFFAAVQGIVMFAMVRESVVLAMVRVVGRKPVRYVMAQEVRMSGLIVHPVVMERFGAAIG